MGVVAYCPKCFTVTLAHQVTGHDICPKCREKYVFTNINHHTWYLMSPEEKKSQMAQWFGGSSVGNDTVASFSGEHRSLNSLTGFDINSNGQAEQIAQSDVHASYSNFMQSYGTGMRKSSRNLQGEQNVQHPANLSAGQNIAQNASQNTSGGLRSDKKTDFILTTGNSVDGKVVRRYLGIFSGFCVVNKSAFANCDPKIISGKLQKARNGALYELQTKCLEANADACVSVTVEMSFFGELAIFTATGTGVGF